MTQRRRLILATAVICVLLFALWLACRLFSHQANNNVPTTSQRDLAYVRAVEVKGSDGERLFSFPGVSESQLAGLAFRVAGPVEEVAVVVGSLVAKGEVIARIDSRDYELVVKRIEAEIIAAEAALAAMTTGARAEDLATLESNLAAAVSQAEQAETNFDRFTKLLEEQAVTQAQFDAIKTQYDVAMAQKEAAGQQLKKGEAGSRKEEIDAATAKIKGLNVSLAEAKNALADVRLTAPYDGYVVEKFVEDHEIVSPGMPVVSFADASVIDVSASLPEEIIVRRSDIIDYACEFEAYPGVLFPAKLKEMGHAIQRGKQSYPLKVRIDVPPETETPLFPGMTAMVKIRMRRANAPLLVPTAALHSVFDDAQTAVWVINPETQSVNARPVKVLRFLDTGAEIEGDIKPGEQIVAAGAHSLVENQKVEIIAEKQ